MKKTIFFTCLLLASMTVCSSCSNEAKEKYEAQKNYIDSLQIANKQAINGALLSDSETGILKTKIKCYNDEAKALDSLKNLAKEAFGDNSAEYKEAYDKMIKAKDAEEKASNEAVQSLRKSLNTF